MNKNNIMAVAGLFLALLLVSGCQTAKSAGKGVGTTAAAAGTAIAEVGKGTYKDVKDAYQAVKKADGWMRDNLW